MHRRALLSAFTVVALGLLFSTAHDAAADVSPAVIKALKGQLIVTDGAVAPGASDKETIAAYKAARLNEVKGQPNAEDVQAWTFHYTAFLKKKGFSALALEFYSGDKFVAEKRLDGIDPSLTVLEGDIDITEDDGPAKGKKYTVKLVGTAKGKDVVVAQTSLTLN